jgi:hypothetical protein
MAVTNTNRNVPGKKPGTTNLVLLAITAIIVFVLSGVVIFATLSPTAQAVKLLPEGMPADQVSAFLKGIPEEKRAELISQLKVNIQARPLDVVPLKQLAAIAQTGSTSAEGDKLVMLTADRDWRDVPLQSSALQIELTLKEYAAAISRLNILFQTQPRKRAEVMSILAGLATNASSETPLIEALAKRPAWRKDFLLDISSKKSVNPDAIYGLLSKLRKSGAAADQGELRSFLQRLVTEGAEDKAYFIWLDSLSDESLRKVGLLHDGGFDLPMTNQFFSWTGYKVPNVDARTVPRGPGSVDKVLRIDFSPARTPYNNFVQILRLVPGSYVLTGEEKADKLETPVGLVWRIHCTTGPVSVLAETKPVSGSSQWTPFETTFEVPPKLCPTQTIRLVSNARTELDTQISGQVQFDNIAIGRRSK